MSEASSVWKVPLERLSASAINTFYKCPEQFRRKYIKLEKETVSISSIIGQAIHAVAENHYRSLIDKGVGIYFWEIEEIYNTTFDQQVNESGGPREIDCSIRFGRKSYTYSLNKAKALGIPVASLYLEKVKDVIEPIGCEEWFELNRNEWPVPIVGKIDLIERQGKRDLKFGTSEKQQKEITWYIQGLIYSLVDETTSGLKNLKSLSFGWHTGSWGFGKTVPTIWLPELLENPSNLLMENTVFIDLVAERLIQSTMNLIEIYWETFGPDDPWPGALQHSWACDFCSFKNLCFWWKGPSNQLTFL